jgi:hypothetical protein
MNIADEPMNEPRQPIDETLTTADFAGTAAPAQSGRVEPRTFTGDSPASGQSTADTRQETPLFPAKEAEELRGRWDSVQAGFVDEPRAAVEQADSLVAGAMKRLAEMFAEERARLEGQWDRGDDVSTEDLRLALQRYRSFFGRLLSM